MQSIARIACCALGLAGPGCAPGVVQDPVGDVESSAEEVTSGSEPGATPPPPLATSACAYDAVAVSTGAEIVVDWSGLTTDVLGDPLAQTPMTDVVARIRTFTGLETNAIVSACGIVEHEYILHTEHLYSEEPAASRTIHPELLPEPGAVAQVIVIGQNQVVGGVFLLPDAASATTVVEF